MGNRRLTKNAALLPPAVTVFVNHPIKKNPTKFEGTPTRRLSNASWWPKSTSLRKIPIAAPTPPGHGPKITAKVAGTKTCGQIRTPKKVGRLAENTPNVVYRAALTALLSSFSENGGLPDP